MITFQSRLGREPWLHPYTDKVLEQLPKDGNKKVKVICPSFTADCLETLEEIAMQGRDSFLEAGGEEYEQIPCLNESPAFIEFLAGKVQDWRQGAYETAKITPPAQVVRK
jgi:ferrochelatase